MLAPERPPANEELEALIREARMRQRRRWLLGAGAIAIAAGVSLALWAALSGGGKVVVRGHGPIRVVVGHVAGTTSTLRGIGDVGSAGGVTWAINGHGFWLTTNGGRTWRNARLPNLARGGGAETRADPIANIAGVQFIDRRRGWVSVMGRSRIYRTTDGGRTWRVSIPPGCTAVCEGGAIDFLDARRGYSLVETQASSNKLFRTADGGRTWQLVSQPSVYGRIVFVDRSHGFAFGGRPQMIIGPFGGPPLGFVYETADGGRTWSRYDPAGSGSFVEQPYSALGHEVFLVQNGPNPDGGLNLAAATIYLTRDAGRHWSGRVVPPGPAVAVSFSAASPNVWAWASGQNLLVTDHAGNGWTEIVLRGLPQRAAIRKIVFTSQRAGWAVLWGFGPHGSLFRTTDGGAQWKPAGPPLEHGSSNR
ncbi:MAG TPA: hypothetical protein VHZ77_01445 [Gaiellaceae bacterium]|nr:hypothetical protein [Gaiellaceae bacterium]